MADGGTYKNNIVTRYLADTRKFDINVPLRLELQLYATITPSVSLP